MSQKNYIEAAYRSNPKAVVEVVRYELDATTGMLTKAFKVEVLAAVALREFAKPMGKRSNVWKRIRPLGVNYDGTSATQSDMNSLSNPELIEQLTAKIKKELQEEMAQKATSEAQTLDDMIERPKKKRKSKEATSESKIEPTITEEGL